MQLILKFHKSGGVEQYNNCVVSCAMTKKLLPVLNKAEIAATKRQFESITCFETVFNDFKNVDYNSETISTHLYGPQT